MQASPQSKFVKGVVPVGILVFALMIAWLLNSDDARQAVEKIEIAAPSVNVQEIKPQTLSLDIRTNGVVASQTKARIVPEVTGKIIWVNKNWHDGGFFKKGEVLLRIEDYQYVNQLARAKAQLAEAHARYVQEQGMVHVAQQEWNKRKNRQSDSAAARSLALREPQLESAKAQYEAAQADVKSAEIQLQKTELKASFDGIVLKTQVDIGQFVPANQQIGEMYAVDMAEVRVPLTESNQHLIDIPALNSGKKTPVVVSFSDKSGVTDYPGYLVRTESILDEVTKVLYGVVQVEDPYQLKSGAGSDKKNALRIGAYVSVSIPGRKLENLYVLPKAVLRGGNRVYTVDEENRLRSKLVSLQSNYDGLTIVASGLAPNVERVVVGRVGEAMEGRKVDVTLLNAKTSGDVLPAAESLSE